MAESRLKKLKYDDIDVGDWIEITKQRAGRVVWKGEVEFKIKGDDKSSFGIELVGSVGKHDGKWNGKRYFTCEKDRGMIVQMDRVRKKIPDPTRAGKGGPGGSSKDLSKIGLSKKTLGIKDDEEEEEDYEEEDEMSGWGNWDAADVLSYINKRLGNHGELFAEAGFTGEKLVNDFRDNANACKQFFRDKGLNPSIGKSLNRYLKNDLTDDKRNDS